MDELSKVDTYITFAEFAKDMRHKSSTVLFDPTLYRANKEVTIYYIQLSATKTLLLRLIITCYI